MPDPYVFGPVDVSSGPSTDINLITWASNTVLDLDKYFHIGFASSTRLGSGASPSTDAYHTLSDWATYIHAHTLPMQSTPYDSPMLLTGGVRQLAMSIWHVPNTAGASFTGLYLTHPDAVVTPPTTDLCTYGTEQKDPGISVIDLFSVAVGRLISGTDPRWLLAIVAGFVGRWIYLERLCSALPPPDEDFEITDFIPSGVMDPVPKASRKGAIKLTRLLWNEYCQCRPAPGGGSPGPGPGTTNTIQPTWYVTNNNYTISNYDIANTLNLYLTLQGGSSHVDNQLVSGQQSGSPCSPAAFEESTVHEDLVGSGRFEISNVVGFKVEAVERDISEPTLSGQPMYLWNMGWISTLAGELLLEEKRVTRSGYYWFPCSMQHATEFTYTLREYTKIKVTELVKPAEIVLAG